MFGTLEEHCRQFNIGDRTAEECSKATLNTITNLRFAIYIDSLAEEEQELGLSA